MLFEKILAIIYAYTFLQADTGHFLHCDVASKIKNVRTYVQSWLKSTK